MAGRSGLRLCYRLLKPLPCCENRTIYLQPQVPIFFCGSKKGDSETDISGQSDVDERSDTSVDDFTF